MWLILKINTTLGELVVLHAVQHYPALCAVSIKVNASDKQSALCHAVFYSLFCTALFLLPMSVCVCQTPSIGLWHPSFYHCLFSYAIGSRKLLANEQFFVGAQTGVSLLQTTQIKQDVSFTATNKVYTCTNKTTIV